MIKQRIGRVVLGMLSWCAITATGSALGQSDPTPVVGMNQIVTLGGNVNFGEPPVVNEPNIIATQMQVMRNEVLIEVPVLIAMWQVGEVPGSGQIEIPVELRYRVAEIDPLTGHIYWGEERAVPMPDGALDARDPALALFGKDLIGIERVAGAGVYVADSIEFESFAFITTAPKNDDELQDPLSLDPQQVAWIRMDDESANDSSSIGENDVYIVGRSLESAGGIDEFQLVLRRSGDGGASWSDWYGLEVEEDVNAYGFPTNLARHGIGGLMFAYMDWDASDKVSLRTLNGTWDFLEPQFAGGSLDIEMNLELLNDPDYFTESKRYLAGTFSIGPFADVAVSTTLLGSRTAYVVYHDLAGEPQGNDGDFDVFIVRGVWNGTDFTWGNPIKVNQSAAHVRSDQFMPTICIDRQERIHVAWYDTRHDLKAPGQDVKIALYYAFLEDNGDGTFDITELKVREEAIHTAYLSNPKSIGDRIDIVGRPISDPNEGVIIVYTATRHPVATGPGSPMNPLLLGNFFDEVIYSQRIDFVP